VHRKTRMPRAVLFLSKAAVPTSMSATTVSRQLELLCKLDHPNIVPFRECCEDERHFQLVYEWCPGGMFMSQLAKYSGMLTEGHIAQVLREVLSALAAAHTFNVHHLDLGLFSLFLQYTDRLSPIKVFGIGLPHAAGNLAGIQQVQQALLHSPGAFCSWRNPGGHNAIVAAPCM